MVKNRYHPLKVSNLCDYIKIVGETIEFLIVDIILTENKIHDCGEGI